MTTRKTTEQFIIESRTIHGNIYEYNHVKYVTAHKKVKINCPIHGIFEQMPNCHLHYKQGCPKCGVKKSHSKTTLTKDKFIVRACNIHGNKYDYSQIVYIDYNTPIEIICDCHGSFLQTPSVHLRGSGCSVCGYASNKIGTDEFIRRATQIHGTKYNYDLVEFERIDRKIKIVCPNHGLFLQQPQSHLITKGCPQCSNEKKSGGFSNQYFVLYPEDKTLDAIVYVVELLCDNEKFLKVGITTQTTMKRFSGHLQYKFQIIYQYKCQLYSAFLLEQKILESYSHYQYAPKQKFKGWTECFLWESKDEIIQSLNGSIGDSII